MCLPLSQAESCWFQCWTPPECCRPSVPHTRSETSCLSPLAPPPPPISASPESAPASQRRLPGSEKKHCHSSLRLANLRSLDHAVRNRLPGMDEPSLWKCKTAAGAEERCRLAVVEEEKKKNTTILTTLFYLCLPLPGKLRLQLTFFAMETWPRQQH